MIKTGHGNSDLVLPIVMKVLSHMLQVGVVSVHSETYKNVAFSVLFKVILILN